MDGQVMKTAGEQPVVRILPPRVRGIGGHAGEGWGPVISHSVGARMTDASGRVWILGLTDPVVGSLSALGPMPAPDGDARVALASVGRHDCHAWRGFWGRGFGNM